MGKYDGILICSDFDNTAAVTAVVPQKNTEAIKYFCDNGGVFSIISGRDIPFVKKYAESLSLRSYVGCVNGTVICHLPTGEIVSEVYVPEGTREVLVKVLRGLGDSLEDVSLFTPKGNTLIENTEDFWDRFNAFEWENVRKFLIHSREPFTEDEASFIKDSFKGLCDAARSWPRGMEVQNDSVNKGKTARKIAELVGAHTLICVGDYENDFTLLGAADISYAVGNAIPAIKEIADRITVPASEGAIAAIIAEL